MLDPQKEMHKEEMGVTGAETAFHLHGFSGDLFL